MILFNLGDFATLNRYAQWDKIIAKKYYVVSTVQPLAQFFVLLQF